MDFLAKVFVTPKAAILDPQGKAIASSLHTMGYEEVADARVGKLIVLRLTASDNARAQSRIEEMCKRLLANEVIEDYRFEVAEEARSAR
jgi:phosphoribosylformylglycinamidine synthase